MKLLIITVWVIASVNADVSHLNGNGYNYDKAMPSADSEQQISMPVNNYLPPPSQYTGSGSDTVSQHQSPSNDYLPPSMQQQQMSQQVSQAQPQSAAGNSYTPSNDYMSQQISQMIRMPNNEYLSPQQQQSAPQQQDNSQSDTSPASNYLPPEQPKTPDYQQFAQPNAAPNSEYLPPQEHSSSASAPANEYQPPHQQQGQYVPPAPAPGQTPMLMPSAQSTSTHSDTYLPPTEQFNPHDHEDQDTQGQAQDDGYHYRMPAKAFRF